MEFASKFVFADIDHVSEDIYIDEVEDGIASCAEEQARVWALAAEELASGVAEVKAEDLSNAAFVRELQQMTAQLKAQKSNDGGKRVGGLGTTTRWQPRLQPGKQAEFDRAVLQHINESVNKAAQAKKLAQKMRKLEMIKAERLYQQQQQQMQQIQIQLPKDSVPCGIASAPVIPSSLHQVVPSNLEHILLNANLLQPGEDIETLVVCPGSSTFKLAIGGDDSPRSVFPAIVGRPRHCGVMVGLGQKDSYVGDEAQSKRGIMTLKYPLENGRVTNWDDFEKILHHSFYNELRVPPEEHPVLITESPLGSPSSREKLLQIMFESFNVPALSLATDPVLTLISTGRTTGVAVQIGLNTTWILPVYEGYAIYSGIVEMPLGGKKIREYMQLVMAQTGFSFTTRAEMDVLDDILCKMSYIVPNFYEATRNLKGMEVQTYEMPDGQTLELTTELFRAPEILFQPALVDLEIGGLQDFVLQSILRCDRDLWPQLLANVVVGGGVSCTHGLKERLELELQQIVPQQQDSLRVRVIGTERYAAVVGGSILTQVPNGLEWITKEEYDLAGPSLVHRIFQYGAALSSGASRIASQPLKKQQQQQQKELTLDDISSDEEEGGGVAAEFAKSVSLESNGDSSQSSGSASASAPAAVEKGLEVICTQAQADSNSVLLHIGQTIQDNQNKPLATGEPVKCEHCEGMLNAFSNIQPHPSGVGRLWVCEFCSYFNDISWIDEDELADIVSSPSPSSSPASSSSGTSTWQHRRLA